MTGHRLGDRYELVERIGSGGMAEVWRATDRSLGRDVAVKLLYPHLAEDDAILARFRSEAQSAARLTHPGIVAIFDTVTTSTTDAIVMELVTGEDLRSILDVRGTLAIADAVEVTKQVAQALGHAHQHGIVHRDVKPANIIVRPDRRVKLSDFGIAKALGDTTLTDSGSLVGTVKYLAPEQIDGRPIDGRTDLYALSIVLFEMVCGRVPFPSSDIIAAMDRMKRVAPRARTIRPDIPPGLDEFLARALSRDPADRPADAATYVASLAAALRRDNTVVSPVPIVEPSIPGASRALDHDRTPPRGADGSLSSNPVIPSIPMRAPATGEVPKPRRRRRRKRDVVWPLLAAALMVAALVVVWILLQSASDVVTDRVQNGAGSGAVATDDESTDQPDDGDADTTTDAPGTSAAPAADSTVADASDSVAYVDGVRLLAFDPEGDSDEHHDITFRALDGDPSTFWYTQSYNDRRFGGIKSGVGIIVEFAEPTKIEGFRTVTNQSGWSVQLYEADQVEASLAEWGEPLEFYENLGREATLEFRPMTTTAVLLWITDLGTDGTDGGGGDANGTEADAAETGPNVRLELNELGVLP